MAYRATGINWQVYELPPWASEIPQEPGVYAIFGSRIEPTKIGWYELLYIGQSQNVYQRMLNHHFITVELAQNYYIRWRKQNFYEMYAKVKIVRRFGQQAMDEMRLLARLQPQLNKHRYKSWAKRRAKSKRA